jgi:hypothetical protein
MEPEYPEHDTPEASGFGKSAILFVVTMGAVFGLGMIWTTYGERIAFEWRRDWNGMTSSWGDATKPEQKLQDAPYAALIPGHRWSDEYERVNHKMNSSRGGRHSSNRSVQPVIDTRRPAR